MSSSREPILQGAWLAPGQHVNLVGASAAVQAGEWLGALKDGVVDESHLQGEIGEVLLGRVPGRLTDADITVYKSLGHTAQDLAAAAAVVRQALGRADVPDISW